MEEEPYYHTRREAGAIFAPGSDAFEAPDRIVTVGRYLGLKDLMDASGELRFHERGGAYHAGPGLLRQTRRDVAWTNLVNALNAGRQWALRRLHGRLEPMLAPGIALVVVPSHDPFQDDPPIRRLARLLAAGERYDATGCLVRHTRIKRIAFGGASYRSLHRQTISIVDPERFAGRPVLLLDDIARSGASLRACREMLYEAGAGVVQAMALARLAERPDPG